VKERAEGPSTNSKSQPGLHLDFATLEKQPQNSSRREKTKSKDLGTGPLLREKKRTHDCNQGHKRQAHLFQSEGKG